MPEPDNSQDLHDLRWVRFHWGQAYHIDIRAGRWVARRRDDKGGLLTAESAEELLGVLAEDYRADPVPRDLE